jgi:hypothetical protein
MGHEAMTIHRLAGWVQRGLEGGATLSSALELLG